MKHNFNTSLLQIVDNQPKISHRVIAEYTENSQVSIRKLIDKHIDKFELFGVLSFEMTKLDNSKKGGRPEKTYYLNEPQATLLLTFMRNNEIVINFKVRLVDEFFQMRNQLQNTKSSLDLKEKKRDDLISVSQSELDKELQTLDFLLNRVHFSEKEKIEFINKTLEKINFQTLENPHLLKHEPVFTLTQLLKEFGVNIRTADFNRKLESYGIIQRFGNGWILLDMRFGENRHFKEGTNHRYYKSTFEELLDLVL